MVYRFLFGVMVIIFVTTITPLSAQAQAGPLCDDGIADDVAPLPPVSMGMGDEEGDSRTANDGAQPERLVAPPVSDNPTQLECGAYHYAQVCMACHGDKGQGLTEEWRAAWGVEEQNCWQSKCHAANHPPEGFQLPRAAPPLMGENALARFNTAADLHGYIQAAMPWHAPGSLDEATYWQLTAFLAQSNGATVTEVLSPATAINVALRPLPTLVPVDDTPPAPTADRANTTTFSPLWFSGYLALLFVAMAALSIYGLTRRR